MPIRLADEVEKRGTSRLTRHERELEARFATRFALPRGSLSIERRRLARAGEVETPRTHRGFVS